MDKKYKVLQKNSEIRQLMKLGNKSEIRQNSLMYVKKLTNNAENWQKFSDGKIYKSNENCEKMTQSV